MNKKTAIIISVILAILASVFFIVQYVQKEEQSVKEALYPRIVEVEDSSNSLEEGSETADFTWVDLEGNKKSLSDYKGKPVILNFWATWCPPCKIEMPDIEEYYLENKDKVVVLAINLTETEKSVETIEELLKENKYTFPVVLDDLGLVSRKYLVRSIPTTYFIGEDGIIKKIYTGPLSKGQIEEYVALP